MSEKAILFDSSRCTACRGCQVACKCWNGLPSTLEKNGNPSTGSYQSPMDLNGDTRLLISFHEEAGGDKGVKWAFGRRSCQHCADAPCATICPGGALKKDEATGFVSVDESKCIGCRYCSTACPFDVPQYHGDTSKINKCTGCLDRVEQGLAPACVTTCQPQALMFGDREEMLSIARERVDYLHGKGYADAALYGEDEVGGLHVIQVLKHGVEAHGQVVDPQVNPMVGLTQIMKPVTGAVTGLTAGHRLQARQAGVQPRDGRHDLRRHRRGRQARRRPGRGDGDGAYHREPSGQEGRQPMSKGPVKVSAEEAAKNQAFLASMAASGKERYIKRHSLQARLTHGITIAACILLCISGLFVFVPALAAAVGADTVFAIRMSHRIIGVVFVAVPLISALLAPKGVAHIFKNLFDRWDSDDKKWMMLFFPYLFMAKWIHMPDQREVKSGQRFADGMLWFAGALMGITGIILLLGTTLFDFGAGVHGVTLFLHDIGFLLIAVFGLAHIFLGAGIFQPYRGTAKLMFGDGTVSESDALYHWGHWARKEIATGENVVEKAK